MAKQTLFDILIVLVLPVCLVGGYLYVGTETLISLVSFSMIGVTSTPGSGSEDLGIKTKAALNGLRAIHLNEAIFDDPTFVSLVDFTGTISTTTIGREHPFSTPEEIRAMEVTSSVGSAKVAEEPRPVAASSAVPAKSPPVKKISK